jgi:hypothetical protein
LLRDRGGALRRALLPDVGPQRSRDAPVVDARVLVESLVLDRDHGVLDVRRDLVARHQDAVVLAGQHRELVAARVEQLRVLGGLELVLGLQRREILSDRHHHPEHGRDDRKYGEQRQRERQAELVEPQGHAPRGGRSGRGNGR